MRLALVDQLIIGFYFAAVLVTGFILRRRVRDSEDFLLSGRSLPLWVTGIAFMAANLGSLEIMGMVANGAKYGMLTNHFYWVGAIPAMIFLGVFMMPFYYQNKVRSVPEYLKFRFDNRTHALNALTFAVMTVLMSGINMFALAVVFRTMLGWTFNFSVLVSAGVVVVYTFLGGLSSSIYNEVLQFCLIVVGFLPLSIRSLAAAGGWAGLRQRLPDTLLHTWRYMGSGAENPFGANWFAVTFGLGFVMSFAYWCTDFLLVQRAMAARSLSAARRTPLVAAMPKMLFPLASFMSGMAGNVTAFNTVWTYDLYQSYIAPGRSDAHYLKVARLATVAGTALSVATAYIVLRFDNLMDYMQLIASFFISPLFATFLLGMFWKRTNATGAFYGMIAGIAGSVGHYLAYRAGWVHYRADMAANFYGAMCGWTASMIVTITLSLLTPAPDAKRVASLVYGGLRDAGPRLRWYRSVEFQGACVLAAFVALDILFW
ncbi:MAG: sodium:solute symporter family protein [Acidobacteriia bacterium]|nr:sodium:solute symporter family protein [Terriglobia bacterium]